jgi:signal recognition particle subunit SRP54
MFGALTEKLQGVFAKLAGKAKLTEDNVSEAVREVRLALLEADVNYGVTKTFVKRVKDKAVGQEVLKNVVPGQQFIKIVHDELVALMGENEAALELSAKPSVVMLCGLQGSGKTTQAAKLAHYLQKKEHNKKVLLAACDLQRPAAIQQLMTLGTQINVPVFTLSGEANPVVVAKKALQQAKEGGFDVLIVDTAGRLHIDERLMQELEELKTVLKPQEILFVANATLGQDAVNTATEINARISITGTILTMLDGTTRGGAAISIREVTGKPLKFEGVGEKVDDIQLFNPTSMADRILGMGDTINLVKKAQEHISEEESKELEKKLRKATFTYEDYLLQMQKLKKMGSIKSLLKMLPLGIDMKMLDGSEKEFGKIEAIILSMTSRERREEDELSMGRRKRVARGSGTKLEDVNKLVKGFKQTKQFFKSAPKMKQLKNMMGGGMPWR